MEIKKIEHLDSLRSGATLELLENVTETPAAEKPLLRGMMGKIVKANGHREDGMAMWLVDFGPDRHVSTPQNAIHRRTPGMFP